MNILYIDHYAGSLSMGMEFRPYYFAREWQKMGHKVRIIGASFSHLRRTNPHVERDFEIQCIDGMEYQWIKTCKYQGNGIKRAISLVQFCTKMELLAAKIVKDFSPDVVISSSTYPLDTYPAQRIARIANAKYVHEAHDLWPLTLIELAGWNKNNVFIKLLAAAEKAAFSKSGAIVGVTAAEADYMLQHGMQSREKFTHIPNGVVVEDWESPEPVDAEHENQFWRLKEQGKFIICYLGGHALSNALDVFLDAAKKLKDDERFAFVMIGNGAEKPRLQKRAKEEQINNLVFLPPVGKKQVPSILKMADALYVGAEPCSLYRFGVSLNKVYDYMMAGKPIIYGVEAANNDVAEAGCGITIKPGQSRNIEEAALSLWEMNVEEREKMGNRGRAWVIKNCDYANLAKKFVEVLSK